MDSLANTNLLADIRLENLSVYRSSPQRIREDVGQESQIAQDYQGRLIYELLQNADDAMEAGEEESRICFQLAQDSLWVANSGRPLDDADVRGLCGISASSKGVHGKKRASIGHKGMGFKSVLEICDAPEVYSTTTCFSFSPSDAQRALRALVDEHVVTEVRRAPVCRFPWSLEPSNSVWMEFQRRGYRTAFRFPFRAAEAATQHDRLSAALSNLPVSSLLFLKRLRCVEIAQSDRAQDRVEWTIHRRRFAPDGGVVPSASLSESGTYGLRLSNGKDVDLQFVIAYDSDIPIDGHRAGLNEFVWEGVEFTEAAVAAQINGGSAIPLRPEWRRLHVFLPSGEPCPYDLLISAAFNSNLSRQDIKIEAGPNGYNRHVVRHIARLFRDQLLPRLLDAGSQVDDVLRLLRRSGDATGTNDSGAAHAVHEAFKDALAHFPLIPREQGSPLPVSECVVPPLVDDESVGEAFRRVLPIQAAHQGKVLPIDRFCHGDLARILVDHGAHALTPEEAASQLAACDSQRARLKEHSTGGVSVDPVLSVLQGLWFGLGFFEKRRFVSAVRSLPLFPVAQSVGGDVTRIVTQDLQCFYPPRSLKGEVGLSGLCFLMQELCWGALNPKERNQILATEMSAWQALFEIHEFKFPDVMRASVLPSLDLDSDALDPRRAALRTLDSLAAICQLAGRMPDSSKPLPYERLGPNRALFNLSRLDVPCRSEEPGQVKWVPAYRAYFGDDWVGEASFECVCKAVAALGDKPPHVDFVVSPASFTGLRDRFRHLEGTTTEEGADEGSDEIAIEEDEEAELDSDDRSRWLVFFRWLGVNVAMRAVHFHDVEDRASGWIKTRTLRKPEGWIFEHVPAARWNQFRDMVTDDTRVKTAVGAKPTASLYFYQLHDLEHLTSLLNLAAQDKTSASGRALYAHLGINWTTLQRFSQLEIAVVDGEPSRRTKPPRAHEDEIVRLDESNFWLHRLRMAPVCPTGHGPRYPAEVWFPTQEVVRRFGRKSRDGALDCLLPTLDLPQTLLKGRARGLPQALMIRDELSPASFTEADASIVVRRIEFLYGERVQKGVGLRQELREVIRPAYRHVVELLSEQADASAGDQLKDAPLLSNDGLGHLAFRPASSVFYVERRDTLDRIGPEGQLWTLVLEAYPAGRDALVALFGCRVLEEWLEWSPEVGDRALSEEQMAEWRAKLTELAPYILARVGADRIDEAQMRRDASRLRNLIARIEPVTNLTVRCGLKGGASPSAIVEREAFVDARDGGSVGMTAFVRWGEGVWPPTENDAEALATVFGEVLGSGYFESFLALVRAPSGAKRMELLRRAGAPTDIDDRRLLFANPTSAPGTPDAIDSTEESEKLKTITSEIVTEQPPERPSAFHALGTQPKQAPLYALGQLSVKGVPVTLTGKGVTGQTSARQSGDRSRGSGGPNSDDGRGAGYGGHTDLELLNALGMAVTLSYEVVRLRGAGQPNAVAFDPSAPSPQPDALVFDVSSPAKIAKARGLCGQFERAFRRLIQLYDVPPEWPGFDVVTLAPSTPDDVDRVIELKASGVSSRVQGMSWNEWKSARCNELRRRYYLYLVGNLRTDLAGSIPFIRTIRDPFEQLLAEVQVNDRLERKVQLAVHLFHEAEHLDLTVDGVQADPVLPTAAN